MPVGALAGPPGTLQDAKGIRQAVAGGLTCVDLVSGQGKTLRIPQKTMSIDHLSANLVSRLHGKEGRRHGKKSETLDPGLVTLHTSGSRICRPSIW